MFRPAVVEERGLQLLNVLDVRLRRRAAAVVGGSQRVRIHVGGVDDRSLGPAAEVGNSAFLGPVLYTKAPAGELRGSIVPDDCSGVNESSPVGVV